MFRVYQEIDPNSRPCGWSLVFEGPEGGVHNFLRWAHRPNNLSCYGRRLKVVSPDGTEQNSGDWMYARA